MTRQYETYSTWFLAQVYVMRKEGAGLERLLLITKNLRQNNDM